MKKRSRRGEPTKRPGARSFRLPRLIDIRHLLSMMACLLSSTAPLSGGWQMEHDKWQMANDRWQMADGGWRMADGRWQMADHSGPLTTDNWPLHSHGANDS